MYNTSLYIACMHVLTTQSRQFLMLVSLSWNNTERMGEMVGDTIRGEAVGTKEDYYYTNELSISNIKHTHACVLTI